MKRKTSKLLALMLAALLAAAFITPVLADPSPSHELSEHEQELLLAFWQQPAYDGMNNGQAVYDYSHVKSGSLLKTRPQYDGGYWTHCLYNDMYNDEVFMFYLYWNLDDWCKTGPAGDRGDRALSNSVHPDLYGPLDLHGTSISEFWGEDSSITHIDDINFNDCPHLYRIRFVNQPAANSITALNCPINWIDTRGSTFKSIAFKASHYTEPMHIEAEGGGNVSVYHDYSSLGNVSRLTASSKEELFMGWYRDGELISAEPYVEVTAGGNYTARFGGDADGDGTAGANDALLLFRMCMGLIPAVSGDFDMDCSGGVDAADALLLMRFAMGHI